MNKFLSILKILFFISLFLPFNSVDLQFGRPTEAEIMERNRLDSLNIIESFYLRTDSIKLLFKNESLITKSKIDSLKTIKNDLLYSIKIKTDLYLKKIHRTDFRGFNKENGISILFSPNFNSLNVFGNILFAIAELSTKNFLSKHNLIAICFILYLLIALLSVVLIFTKRSVLNYITVILTAVILLILGLSYIDSIMYGYYISLFLISFEIVLLLIQKIKPVANIV